jgi:hypothetical protein
MGILATIASWFFSRNSSGQSGIDTVANLADKAVYTKQEKAEDDAADLASARAFTPAPSHNTWFDALIDGWHRAIRPTVATWCILQLFGAIAPPKHLANIPPEIWSIIMLVLSFYFGGRVLLRDLPAAIQSLRK